jgi:membrane associated rhomboid family serine protease
MTQQTPGPAEPGGGVPTCYRHPGRESYIRCQRCDKTICPDCMNDAAVGFQCPDCIKAGAKQTRSGRTAYGGLRPTDASTTSVTLIVVNVAVWVGLLAAGGFASRLFDLMALRPQAACRLPQALYSADGAECTFGGTLMPGVADGAYWQLLTSMFTHVSPLHLAFNMLALWVLGPQLELVVGRVRFLALYFLAGLAGGALVMWAGPQFSGTHGASGAVYGLMAALLVVALKVGGDARGLLLWVGINALLTFTIPNISWQGHLGGFLGGLLVGAILVHAPRGPRRTRYQVVGMVAVGVLVVAAIAARIIVVG